MQHARYTREALKKMARDIADMHYQDMSYLIGTLSDNLALDADKDHERNRVKLAKVCESASVHLSYASLDLEGAMEISRKYME